METPESVQDQPTRSTNHQIVKELDVMYNKMRDPEEHQKAQLKDNLKQNVNRNTKRFGL